MATLHACRISFNPHEAFPLNKQPHLPLLIKRNKQLSKSINAVATDIITSDPTQVDITWQIVVGSLAGVTPFVVAGVEFSKRIVKQRKCEVCGGSGLVLKKKYYRRCPNCGGFLPWQSWRRFFTEIFPRFVGSNCLQMQPCRCKDKEKDTRASMEVARYLKALAMSGSQGRIGPQGSIVHILY